MYILTIAVPIYNMEWCLEKNLATYDDPRLLKRLEVLCLNNASEDSSKAIIEKFTAKSPDIFRLIDRDSRGYGSSINDALQNACGKYFRIVDADDWVNTEDLIRLLTELEKRDADVVLTDYQIVDLRDGSMTPVRAGNQGAVYGEIQTSFTFPIQTLPTIHCTTYLTRFLRSSGFQMQDMIFFVDEEYVILPYLSAQTILYLDLDIYRYAVSNPEQSTSPKNRGRFQEHREKVLRRLIQECEETRDREPHNPALPYCEKRITKGVGDHFTTLLIYVEDRKEGRRLAWQWEAYIRETAPQMWKKVRGKAAILYGMNLVHLSISAYLGLKKVVRG